MTRVRLRYGKGSIEVDIPEKNLMGIIEPKELPRAVDEIKEINEAIKNPINSKKISEIVKNKEKVVIIVSDITRPTPSSKILPPLLNELYSCGIKNKDVTIVFALGIHRAHTEKERKNLVGEEIYRKIRCIDHDPENCINIGKTSYGTNVDIFKPVAEADVVICTGNVEFHYFAGYSGGSKAVMPGVSSKRAIQENHRMMVLPKAEAGRLDSPVRLDIDEAGEILGVDFALNVVLNEKKEIVKAFAGNPTDVYKAGAKYVDMMYKVPVDPADIVITCAGGSPKDINLYQAQKALDNAKNAVKDGGAIILVAECSEGFGESTFEEWIREAKDPEDLIKRLEENFVLGGHKAAAIALVMRKAECYLVSNMPEDLAKEAFFIPKGDLQEALEEALRKQEDAKVLVMPYGGSTLPFPKTK